MLTASLYLGAEQDVSKIVTLSTPAGGRPDGTKRFGGLRAGGQAACGEQTVWFADAGWQSASYGTTNQLFLVQRSDRFQDLELGAVWHWQPLWSLRPQLSYARNHSNIPIYSYTRADVSITLRRDFK
jgi:hypothetical protein